MLEIEKNYVKFKGLNILYRQISAQSKNKIKKNLVLIHGWNTTGATNWVKILKVLAHKKSEYNIYAIDLPGMGESQTPKKTWSAIDYADYIYELLRQLKIDNPILVGHSIGGGICSIISATHPKFNSKLILIAPAIVRSTLKPHLNLIQKFTKLNKQILTKIFPKKLFNKTKDLWYKILKAQDYNNSNEQMKKILDQIIHQDLLSFQSKIKAETTIIWGTKDTYTPIWQLNLIQKEIQHTHIKILPEINHGVHINAANSLTKIILKTM
jgi:pimeloyl-ACP methyl ester carboxylesterase